MFEFLITLELAQREKYKKDSKSYEVECMFHHDYLESFGMPSDKPEDLVNYYMAYAIKYLAMFSDRSLLRRQLEVHSTNKSNSQIYIWTSLMLLGSMLPDKKFNNKQVRIVGEKTFDETTQLGYLTLFSMNSLYETEFKKYLTEDKVKGFLISPTKEFSEKCLNELKREEEGAMLEEQRRENAQLAVQQRIRNARRLEERRRKNELRLEEQRQQAEEEERKFIELCEGLLRFCELPEDETRIESNSHEEVTLNSHVTLYNISRLIKHGADIDYNNGKPLKLALTSNNHRTAEYLLKLGANPFILDEDDITAADLVTRSSPIAEIIKECRSKMKFIKNFTIPQLNKFLLEEVSNPTSKTKTIKRFLNHGADVNCQTDDGYTPLMFALDSQNDRIAEYLLRQGADPFLTNKNEEKASDLVSRSSPVYEILKGYELLYATLNEDINLVKATLKDGAHINFRGHNGYTALLISVEEEFIELAELLIAQGADLSITRKDGKGALDLTTNEAMLNLLNAAKYTNEADIDATSEIEDTNDDTISFNEPDDDTASHTSQDVSSSYIGKAPTFFATSEASQATSSSAPNPQT